MTVNPSAHLVSIEETEEDIRLHWRFTALMPVDQARQRLQEYFAQLGYTLVASDENTLTMRRGAGDSALDWSPRSKKAELIARFTPSKSRTGVAIELRLYDGGDYEAECRLYAWELVEAEQYLHGEPVNFTAMKQYNHHIRMQVFRASVRGFVAGMFLALIAMAILYRVLPGMGIEGWLLHAIVGTVAHIPLWLSARAMRQALGSRKR
ncbi:MAG: hypothetical protein K6U77_05125 [Armatimonadetes bacterium]|nr:hypothetical protein [Armatimonadota bacterium]